MFDSSMVNEPSGFEPLKCYCTRFRDDISSVNIVEKYLVGKGTRVSQI